MGAAQVDYVPTTNLAQGLAALLHFDAAKTLQENSAVMRREAKEAHSAAVSIAVRDSVVNGITVKKGQYIGLLEDKIVYAGATLEEVTAETVKLAGSDWELISLYYGSDLTQSEADKIAAELEALDGGWEVTVFDGGQPLYPLPPMIKTAMTRDLPPNWSSLPKSSASQPILAPRHNSMINRLTVENRLSHFFTL